MAGWTYLGTTLFGYSPKVNFKEKYLTFEFIQGSGEIGILCYDDGYEQTFEYRKNGGNWTEIMSSTEGDESVSVELGDIVEFRADFPNGFIEDGYPSTFFVSGSAKCNVYGNILSLLYYDDFVGRELPEVSNVFSELFSGCSAIIDASKLILPNNVYSFCYYHMFSHCSSLTIGPELPAVYLKQYCYYFMFSYCTSLTTVPELPATTLDVGCYGNMFQNCTSLTIAQSILPATTLASNCYFSMFMNCTSLTTAPELPATILIGGCYSNMFYGCSSLNYIKCLAVDLSVSSCTNNWVNGVAATGTFVQDAGTEWTTGNNGIPTGWTINREYVNPENEYLTFIVNTPGTITWTLINEDYSTKTIYYSKNYQAFTSLTSSLAGETISVVAGDVIRFYGNNDQYANNVFGSDASCEIEIRGNVMSLLGQSNFRTNKTLSTNYTFTNLFRYLRGTTFAENLVLPATTLTYNCYANMFYGCNKLISAPKILPATTLVASCYMQMFRGCSSLTIAPILPAINIHDQYSSAGGCYTAMFLSCSNLNYVKCLAVVSSSDNNYTSGWLSYVASTGTFVKHPNMNDWRNMSSNYGIPSGWTIVDADDV